MMSEIVRQKILAVLDEHSRTGSAKFKSDNEIARATGEDVSEVQRQLDILEVEDLVSVAKGMGPTYGARIKPKGMLLVERSRREEDSMPSIFVCHSSKDKFFVRELAGKLSAVGVRVWLDEAEIKIGDSLTVRIGQAIGQMDYFAVVLSRHSIDSEWVQRELQIAMQRELKERKVIILPLLLELVEIPPFLRDKQYADFTSPERFNATFPRLLEALGIKTAVPQPRAPEESPPPLPPQSPAQRRLAEFERSRDRRLGSGKVVQP
jgi:DNA-binding transcriptional ArsR family regulator